MDVQKCFAITIQYFCTWIPYIFDSFEGRVWDLTALVPDHCLFFTLQLNHCGYASLLRASALTSKILLTFGNSLQFRFW